MNTNNNEQLARLVQAAWMNPRVQSRIASALIQTIMALDREMTLENAREWLGRIPIEMLRLKSQTTPIGEVESSLAGKLRTGSLETEMGLRAKETSRHVNPHLRGHRLLDLGGGSGEIALEARSVLLDTCATPPTVAISDVRDWRSEMAKTCTLFIASYDTGRIECKDDLFDTVMVLTVLHHCEHPERLLREAFRVATQRVIIIESVTESLEDFLYGAFIDWFYNRVIHFSAEPSKKVPVPCHFLPVAGWEQMVLRSLGLTPTVSEDLGVYQVLNPERHHLLVYDLAAA